MLPAPARKVLEIDDPVTKIATVSSLGQIGGGDMFSCAPAPRSPRPAAHTPPPITPLPPPPAAPRRPPPPPAPWGRCPGAPPRPLPPVLTGHVSSVRDAACPVSTG